MKKITILFSTLAIILSTALLCQAQEKEPAEVKKMLDERNYIFKAQTVNPQQGRMRQLTPEYDLTVTRDTIISYLPYFGRAYSAPIDPTKGGIKFTSTDFVYEAKEKKKSWEIRIRPKDASDVQDVYLTVFTNGRASLRVNSVNRQPISFNGYLVEGAPREKKAF